MSADILAIAEHRKGALCDPSFEVITAAAELLASEGGTLDVAVIGGPTEEFAAELAVSPVDTVYRVPGKDEPNHDLAVEAVDQLAAELDPDIVVIANTVNGMDFAPAVAIRLDLPLITDAIDLGFADGRLDVTREMYGSKVETDLAVHEQSAVVTIRPGEWPETHDSGDTSIELFEPELEDSVYRTTVTGYSDLISDDVDISEAEILISVGRGIADEENIELIEEFADAIGGTIAASRPIVDNGWLPKSRQVGQSGKDVSPNIYVAIGISGAVQHISGIKGADTIMAINTDPNAPIFDHADYGIVDDLFDVVPVLIEQFS